jgi:hypothetical protein
MPETRGGGFRARVRGPRLIENALSMDDQSAL